MRNQEEEIACSFNQTIFYEVGYVKDIIRVRVLELFDLFENYSYYAIRFEFFDKKNEQVFYANVPGEEVESFIIALDKINNFLNTKSKYYSEVVFKSAEGFETGCYWEQNAKKWIPYARFGNVPESVHAFNKRDYKTFITRINEAKEKIL